MAEIKDNRDINCYFVTKHSWKGKYKRIFSVGTHGITTYNPVNLENTNQWPYNEFSSIVPNFKAQGNNEFFINIKKAKKIENMKFSSDHRADILTESLRFSHLFGDKFGTNKSFTAYKQHWSETKIKVVLEVTPACIYQRETSTNKLLGYYDYKDIDYITNVSDLAQGFVIANNGFCRLHMFQCDDRENLLRSILEYAGNYVGVSVRLKKESITFDQFINERFGKFNADESVTSLTEFTVYKESERHSEPVRRLLCLSEQCIIERDPATYSICTLKPLTEIFAIIRNDENPQKFSIEYMRGPVRVYSSSDRDSLLASLLDGVRASGNAEVCIKMKPTKRGFRLGPFSSMIDEEVETLHLKFVYELPPGYTINQILERFNVNIPYSGLINATTQDGLFAENKEKLILNTLSSLRDLDNTQNFTSDQIESEFHSLRRLMASKTGYKAFTNLPRLRETIGKKMIKALKREEDSVTYAAIEFLNALMQPMHSDYELKQEQLNKIALLSSKKFLEGLIEIFINHVKKGTGALVIAAMLDFLTFALCPPFSETTDGEHFDNLLELVALNGRMFYKLFQHPSLAIVKGAGMVMKAIIEEGTQELASRMQGLSLSEGAMPRHLHTSIFTQSIDARMLTMRQLSRSLVALWATSNPTAHQLLQRIFPAGLIYHLSSSEQAPKDRDLLNLRDNLTLAIEHNNEVNQSTKQQIINRGRKIQKQILNAQSVKMIEKQLGNVLQHWKQRVGGMNGGGGGKADDKVIVLRRRRQRLKSTENWDMFYYKFNMDHALPNLIWNFKCREELREAIENEIRAFNIDKDLGQGYIIAWNYNEFEVPYNCLSDEIKIGEYYLRLLLESGNDIIENITKGLGKSSGGEEADTLKITENGQAEIAEQVAASTAGSELSSTEANANEDQSKAVVVAKKDNSSGEERSRANSKSNLEIKNAIVFFNDLYHRFLLSSNMKSMCLQAMTIVYTSACAEIGPFNDTKYIVAMLDRSVDKLERDRLLMFINTLILEKRNVKEIIDGNGIRILVDMLTMAHLHTSRAYLPTQTNVIEAATDAVEGSAEKEWYYGNKVGPFSFKEMRDLYAAGTIDVKTRCWAQGMDGWRTIDKIPQLKWSLLATGQAKMNETSMSILILNMLIKMTAFYPSRDQDGSIIRPLPKIKRLLSESTCLTHLVQLLLTFDPIIVEKVATLLHMVVQDNPVISRLYLTGVFFFISMYTGSNILPIARFLEYTHMKQAFRAEDSGNDPKSDIVQRSILGHIYPEAMICYLENHGYEKFAQCYLGEFDTPEVIWNSEMKRFMIEKIAGHLAEFSPRLKSNTRSLYQYCPIPIIVYPQLQNEIFCNIYYLKHLCDEKRFGGWKIKEPVQLLKDCLIAWKKEIEKKPPTMSIYDAYEILELISKEEKETNTSTIDDNKIRRAYFKLAQKYHPDKNPEGRDMFEKVNKAYEFLCSAAKIKDGPDPENIRLILKTQCILFKAYGDILAPYKYAGYPMLIRTLQTETRNEQLFSKKDQLLTNSTELVYQTIHCSALNAEELRREQGFELLNEAFTRCVSQLSQFSKDSATSLNDNETMSVHVCVFITKCYSAAAQFELCRQKMFSLNNLIKDLCRCLQFKNLTRLCLSAADAVSSMAPDLNLQTMLHDSGVLVHLLFYMFNYDFTLEEGGVERSSETNQQEIENNLARLCFKACARLAGFHNGFNSFPEPASANNTENTFINPPPKNEVMKSLISLLTPYLARNINKDSNEILKLLNLNTRNPYLLWDNATRAELRAYLETERENLYKKGECADINLGTMFKYSTLEKELVIGDIYVRIFNEMPTFMLEDPKQFSVNLLDFLGSHAQYLYSVLANPNSFANDQSNEKLKLVESAIEALRNVMKHNDGSEAQCIGQFKLLFMLLRFSSSQTIQTLTLETLLIVTANKECVTDIANSDVLVNLLLTLHSFVNGQQLAIECLYALASNTKIVKDMVQTGGILYVLNIFCSGGNSTSNTRQKCAELLAKLTSDKLTGPRIRLILQKFLPPLFMDAMKDNAEASLITFEGTYENPELIWNEEARQSVCAAIRKMTESLYKRQSEPNGTEVKWTILEDLQAAGVQNVTEVTATLYSSVTSQNELVVSGVYIRLFVANPGWVLRKPREFLTDLFDLWSDVCNKKAQEGERLELLTQALVQLFAAHPLLMDNLPTMGVLPQVIQTFSSKKDAIVGAGLQVLNQIVNNENCLKSMTSYADVMNPLKHAMQRRPDLVTLAAESLSKIFSNQIVVDEFVGQSLKCEMIEYMLKLLESSMSQVDKPAAVKAQIVKALKAMLNSIQHMSQVEAILSASRIWKDYKDQKHDLFITTTATAGYLTNSVPSVAGYLTAGPGGMSNNNATEKTPPPDMAIEE